MSLVCCGGGPGGKIDLVSFPLPTVFCLFLNFINFWIQPTEHNKPSCARPLGSWGIEKRVNSLLFGVFMLANFAFGPGGVTNQVEPGQLFLCFFLFFLSFSCGYSGGQRDKREVVFQ